MVSSLKLSWKSVTVGPFTLMRSRSDKLDSFNLLGQSVLTTQRCEMKDSHTALPHWQQRHSLIRTRSSFASFCFTFLNRGHSSIGLITSTAKYVVAQLKFFKCINHFTNSIELNSKTFLCGIFHAHTCVQHLYHSMGKFICFLCFRRFSFDVISEATIAVCKRFIYDEMVYELRI